MKASLNFPSRHPYLLVTPADVARAKERAERHTWAKQVLERIVRDARSKASRPLGKLPPKGDQRHWSVAADLVRVGLGYAFTGDERLAQWVRDGLPAYADLYPTLEWTNRRCRVFTQSSFYEAMWVESIAEGPTNSPKERMPVLILRRRGPEARFLPVFERVDPEHPLSEKDVRLLVE